MLKNPKIALLSSMYLWGVAGLELMGAQSTLMSVVSKLFPDPGLVLNASVLISALISVSSPMVFAEIYGELQPYVVSSILFGLLPVAPYLFVPPFRSELLPTVITWWKDIVLALLALWGLEFAVSYRKMRTFRYRYVRVHRFVFR